MALEEMRLKRESRLAEIGPPPEDKSAKKGPAEEDAGPEQPEEDEAPATKAQPKKAKTVKPYKTKKQKRRELEDAQENSFDSDLSESDFISGSYTKKRMEEFAAKREALKLSQDLERQRRRNPPSMTKISSRRLIPSTTALRLTTWTLEARATLGSVPSTVPC